MGFDKERSFNKPDLNSEEEPTTTEGKIMMMREAEKFPQKNPNAEENQNQN